MSYLFVSTLRLLLVYVCGTQVALSPGMTATPTTQTTIVIPVSLHHRAKLCALLTGRTLAEVIAAGLERELEVAEKKAK